MIRLNYTEMHEGFPQKELRDFLSKAMAKSYDDEANNQRGGPMRSKFEDAFDWAIEHAKAEIEYFKRYIQNIETKKALILLIEMNGWKEHDVSEDAYNDTEYRNHMSFIGTEDELEELHHKIYEHDEK